MYKKEFKIKILTPLFNFGEKKSSDELRAQSLKGLLRFWWRSVSGIKNLKTLLEKENYIFGSSENGKSKVFIKVKAINVKKSSENLPYYPLEVISSRGKFNINILDYLAYGPAEYSRERRGMVYKTYIKPESEFLITISSFDEKSFKEALKSFYLLFKFGNIGAKSRNGFGGFYIVEGNFDYDFKGELKKALKNELSPYISFSKKTVFLRTESTFESWHEALSEIAKAYRSSRLSLEHKHNYSVRSYISAPIMEGRRNRAFLERHSKSIFIKVKKENGRFRGYITYLPYDYLKENRKRRNDSLNRYLNAYGRLIDGIKNNGFNTVEVDDV